MHIFRFDVWKSTRDFWRLKKKSMFTVDWWFQTWLKFWLHKICCTNLTHLLVPLTNPSYVEECVIILLIRHAFVDFVIQFNQTSYYCLYMCVACPPWSSLPLSFSWTDTSRFVHLECHLSGTESDSHIRDIWDGRGENIWKASVRTYPLLKQQDRSVF